MQGPESHDTNMANPGLWIAIGVAIGAALGAVQAGAKTAKYPGGDDGS